MGRVFKIVEAKLRYSAASGPASRFYLAEQAICFALGCIMEPHATTQYADS